MMVDEAFMRNNKKQKKALNIRIKFNTFKIFISDGAWYLPSSYTDIYTYIYIYTSFVCNIIPDPPSLKFMTITCTFIILDLSGLTRSE